MLFHKGGQLRDGLGLLPLPVGGIDHGGVQHLAVGVDDRHLAAHAVARVETHGDVTLHRGLHQKLTQVHGEVLNSTCAGGVGKGGAGFTLHAGLDKAMPRILACCCHEVGGAAALPQRSAADDGESVLVGKLGAHLQKALFFTAVEGQHAVILHAAYAFAVVVVVLIDALFLLRRHGGQHAAACHGITQFCADGGVVGDVLGDDVGSACQGVLGGQNALFLVDVALRQHRQLGQTLTLCVKKVGKGLKTLFPCDGGAGAALLLIGTVHILHLGEGLGLLDGGGEVVGHLPLLGDGAGDLLFTLGKVAEILQALL